MAVDLHIHSDASDGLHTPAELLAMARDAGLSAIAITDHDSVASVPAALELSSEYSVEVVPGLEMSSQISDKDAHFLGYYIDYETPKLSERLEWLRKARAERAAEILKLLKKEGIELSFESLLGLARGGSVGRPHIAELLVSEGFAPSFQDAFKRYLQRDACCYVEKEVLPPEEIIQMIRGLGGVVVVAHPGVSGLDEHIDYFVSLGLQGLEAYHADHTPEQVEHYLELAKRLGVIVTGGSDYHGEGVRETTVGCNKVPDWVLDRLKQAAVGFAR